MRSADEPSGPRVHDGTLKVLRPDLLFVRTDARPRCGVEVTIGLPETKMGALETEAFVRWHAHNGIGIQLDRPGPKIVWALHRVAWSQASIGLWMRECVPGQCAPARAPQPPSHPMLEQVMLEAIGSLMHPNRARAVVDQTLKRIGLSALPREAQLMRFVTEHALYDVLEAEVGGDAAEFIISDLAPILEMATRAARPAN